MSHNQKFDGQLLSAKDQDPALSVYVTMEQKIVTRPCAISLIIGEPSHAIPRLASVRGLIVEEAFADVIILDRSKISQVEGIGVNGISLQ